jgi:hypothetical protein
MTCQLSGFVSCFSSLKESPNEVTRQMGGPVFDAGQQRFGTQRACGHRRHLKKCVAEAGSRTPSCNDIHHHLQAALLRIVGKPVKEFLQFDVAAMITKICLAKHFLSDVNMCACVPCFVHARVMAGVASTECGTRARNEAQEPHRAQRKVRVCRKQEVNARWPLCSCTCV